MRIMEKHGTFTTVVTPDGVRTIGDLTVRSRAALAAADAARDLARALDSELYDTILEMRAAGLKWESIARRLEMDYRTLHSWCQDRRSRRADQRLSEINAA